MADYAGACHRAGAGPVGLIRPPCSILCRHLGGKHPLCRFQVDKRIGIEMRGNDICPFIQDLMQCLIVLDIEDGDRATPDTGVDVPAHTPGFILGNPWPEALPKLCEIGRSFGPWRRDDEKQHNGGLRKTSLRPIQAAIKSFASNPRYALISLSTDTPPSDRTPAHR